MDSIAGIGSPAPNFELEDLEGKRHSPRDEFGSILVLNFWSAECVHSQRADEEFEDLAQVWGEGVAFWCIASNENEDDELIRNTAAKNKIVRLLRDQNLTVADALVNSIVCYETNISPSQMPTGRSPLPTSL
jgi:thiol-disulfide isomerase/thioredoxin